jgi:hypothetical protein
MPELAFAASELNAHVSWNQFSSRLRACNPVCVTFANGFSASIVPEEYSPGTYELAVLDEHLTVIYWTHITSDVLARLAPGEIGEVLIDIAAL